MFEVLSRAFLTFLLYFFKTFFQRGRSRVLVDYNIAQSGLKIIQPFGQLLPFEKPVFDGALEAEVATERRIVRYDGVGVDID